MPQRWAIRLGIEGDLRFLSHHDTMRVVERTAARADLPVRYSQGFNPRPRISLACPRPVGVATEDDLVVMVLEDDDAGMDAGELRERLNRCAPTGMQFLRAEPLRGTAAPRPRRVHYALPLDADRAARVRARLAELAATDRWPVERRTPGGRRRRAAPVQTRRIDLRPLVSELKLDGRTLRMVLVGGGDLWARPGEVLGLLGLDERVDLARTVRVRVDCAAGDRTAGCGRGS